MKKLLLKNASAIIWPDKILISSSSTTVSGFSIDSAPFISLQRNASFEEIGHSINVALDNNKYKIPDPDWKDKTLNIERFKVARVKSEKAYMTDSRLVHISKNAERITITPTRNGGTQGDQKGFEYIIDQTTEMSLNYSDKEIGMKVRDMWNKCTIL